MLKLKIKFDLIFYFIYFFLLSLKQIAIFFNFVYFFLSHILMIYVVEFPPCYEILEQIIKIGVFYLYWTGLTHTFDHNRINLIKRLVIFLATPFILISLTITCQLSIFWALCSSKKRFDIVDKKLK